MRVFPRAVLLYEQILCHDHRGRGVTFDDTNTPHFLVSTINVIPSGLMWCLLVICLRCTDKLISLLLSHFKCWESERITYYIIIIVIFCDGIHYNADYNSIWDNYVDIVLSYKDFCVRICHYDPLWIRNLEHFSPLHTSTTSHFSILGTKFHDGLNINWSIRFSTEVFCQKRQLSLTEKKFG